jgi:ligand-binding sensor domain-containing protein
VRTLWVAALVLLPRASTAAPGAVFTSTTYVEALAADGDTLWAATRGGIEAWDLPTLTRRHLYTTADGLTENAVNAVSVEKGVVHARTRNTTCTLEGTWRCTPAPPVGVGVGVGVGEFRGHRITAQLEANGRLFVGTTDGLWLASTPSRRLTSDDQICSNHVVALATFAGKTWFASFDEGVCSFDGAHFARTELPSMANDLLTAGGALYAATTRGLFVTRDGRRWRQVPGLDGRGVVDLASDDRFLWAVTPASLWRLPLRPRRGSARGWWQPAGSHALQAVDVRGGVVWVATEDRGLLRLAGGRFQVLDRAAGLPSSWAIDVAAGDDGGAWLATLRDGLVRIAPDGSSTPVAGDYGRWSLHVRAAGTTVWVGTQSGAAALDVPTGAVLPLAGLPHPSVHALYPSADGLWVATEGGIALYRGPLAFRPE